MERKKDYIKSPQHWKDMYTHPDFHGAWKPVSKVPVEMIKIDKRLFAFQNELSHSRVSEIKNNFDIRLWIPILVNEDFFLLDGQHRLSSAKEMGLKYIDVIVESKSLLENPPETPKSRLSSLTI